MAIPVNTVYPTVLSILNKEQRGYLTPYEFNKIATQVQLEIFEKLFEDLNQYTRMPKTDVEFASRIDHAREELEIFIVNNNASSVSENVYTLPLEGGTLTGTLSAPGTGYSSSTTPLAVTGGSGSGLTVNVVVTGGGPGPVASFTIASTGSDYVVGDTVTITGGNADAQITINTVSEGVYRYGASFYQKNPNTPEIQIVSKREYHEQLLSPILQPNKNFPIALYTANTLTVFPSVVGNSSINDITFNYIRKPKDITWNYTVGGVGQYIYNATGSQDFEIDDSNQTEVILEILKYTGVVIRDPQIVQAAAQELGQNEVNAKR